MIFSQDGFKIRLSDLGASGLLIEIDHHATAVDFRRTVEILAVLPAPPLQEEVQVTIGILSCGYMDPTEAALVHKAFGIGLELLPALEIHAKSAQAAIGRSHGFRLTEYSAVCDSQLRIMCQTAGFIYSKG